MRSLTFCANALISIGVRPSISTVMRRLKISMSTLSFISAQLLQFLAQPLKTRRRTPGGGEGQPLDLFLKLVVFLVQFWLARSSAPRS